MKAARVQGAADSLRFNISYYTTRCERFGGFEDRDSSGIHVIYLKSLSTGCDCSDTLHMEQVPYAFKTPAAGTYYYKWGPFDGAIDTIVIN
ncbi:hypothetical protein [Chitinophaga qingshengii]|uniref:DUF1573 domain-containing protein n=1 Tax=Chitinophaga qingshengii TaxID=1569794 RepID=A0ABR7TIN2_9BACT|nr:hypothetical protein [Chitinophaga qingshengii]MBC9930366.1 hypothetical protein [Chitinophaga qingshengii]